MSGSCSKPATAAASWERHGARGRPRCCPRCSTLGNVCTLLNLKSRIHSRFASGRQSTSTAASYPLLIPELSPQGPRPTTEMEQFVSVDDSLVLLSVAGASQICFVVAKW